MLSLAGLLRFLSYEPAPPAPRQFELGPSSTYPSGSRTLLAEIPAILFHSPNGFQAISLTCPHLGCTVEPQADEFVCPCHGSRYDLTGKFLEGPAAQSLKTLRVEITPEDKIILYKG
jgi:Rieske Fe-S protein